MSGERDLGVLLRTLLPLRHPGAYVFVVVPEAPPPGTHPVATIREPEGLTLVLPREEADAAGLPYDLVTAWITLQVHSALDAVGLTAALTTALTRAGISANVVAGARHDHLFVPEDRAEDALAVLQGSAAQA